MCGTLRVASESITPLAQLHERRSQNEYPPIFIILFYFLWRDVKTSKFPEFQTSRCAFRPAQLSNITPHTSACKSSRRINSILYSGD